MVNEESTNQSAKQTMSINIISPTNFKIQPTLGNTNLKKNDQESDVLGIDVIVNLGLDVCDGIAKYNAAFSGIIFCYSGVYLFTTTATFYTTFVQLVVWGIGDPTKAIFVCINFWTVTGYILKLYYLISSGNDLAKTMKVCKLALEDYLVCKTSEDYQYENQNEKATIHNKIDLLKDRLNNDAPISPYGYFGVTNSSLLAAFANILTYVIILIQFKLSEEPK